MQETTPPAGLLRPLGFGELFDRAVTLYVQNFLPFSLIVLIVMVPYALMQYTTQAQSMEQLSTMLKGVGSATADPITPYSNGSLGFILLMFALFLTVLPFMFNAVAFGVARLYTGQRVEVAACYGRAFKRFWPIVGLILMAFLICIGVVMGFALIIGLGAAIAIGLGTLGKFFAIVGIIVVVLVYLAMICALVLLGIALGFAMLAVVIEGKSVFDAIGEGFSRVFSRAEIGRALLYMLASIALSIVNAIVVYGIMAIAIYLHQPWLVTLENIVVSTIVYAFGTVLFAVYYYDVRIRREGLDLATTLESLASTTPA